MRKGEFMKHLWGKGTVLWKMGLVMALVAMVIICPLSRTTLQAQTESGGAVYQCSTYRMCPFDFICYCDAGTGKIAYCDVIWQGGSCED
jgi:hypothetical protein